MPAPRHKQVEVTWPDLPRHPGAVVSDARRSDCLSKRFFLRLYSASVHLISCGFCAAYIGAEYAIFARMYHVTGGVMRGERADN